MSSDKNEADDDAGDDVASDAAKERCCVETKDMDGQNCHINMNMADNYDEGDRGSNASSASFCRQQAADFRGSPCSNAESQSLISNQSQCTPDPHTIISSSEVSHRQAASTPCKLKKKCPTSDCTSIPSSAEISDLSDIAVDEASRSFRFSPTPSNVLWKLHSFVENLGEQASSWLTADPADRDTTNKFSDSSKSLTAGLFPGQNIPHESDKRMYSNAKRKNVRHSPSPCGHTRICLAPHSASCFTPENAAIDRPSIATHRLNLESLKNCFPVQEQPLDLSLRRNDTENVKKTTGFAPGNPLLRMQYSVLQNGLPFVPFPAKTANKNLNPTKPTNMFSFPPVQVYLDSNSNSSGRSNRCHAKSSEANPQRCSAVRPPQGKRHLSSHNKLPVRSSGNRVRREIKGSRLPIVHNDHPVTRKQWSSRKPCCPAKPLSSSHRVHTQYKCNCGVSFETLYQQAVHMEATGHCPSRKGPSETETFEYQKLVRGQDLWLNYGSEQAREILRCMRCQRSFVSLSELTLHMIQTKHYEEIVGSSTSNNILTETTRKKQQNPVASDEVVPPNSQKWVAVNGKCRAWRVDNICSEKKKDKNQEPAGQRATCPSKPGDPKEAALVDGKQGDCVESAVCTATSNKQTKHKTLEQLKKEEKDQVDLQHLTPKPNNSDTVKVTDDAILKITDDESLKVADDATPNITYDANLKFTDNATLKVTDYTTLKVTDDDLVIDNNNATVKLIEEPPLSGANTSSVSEVHYRSSIDELANAALNDDKIDQNEIQSKTVATIDSKKTDASSDDSRSCLAVSSRQTHCSKRTLKNSHATEQLSTELDEFKAPAPKMSKRRVVFDPESFPTYSKSSKKHSMAEVRKKTPQPFNLSPASSHLPGRKSVSGSPAEIAQMKRREHRRFSSYDANYSGAVKYSRTSCTSPESKPNRFVADPQNEANASALDAMEEFIAKSFSANVADPSESVPFVLKAAVKADKETHESPNCVSCTNRTSFTRWTYGACSASGKETCLRPDSGYSRAEQLEDKSSALKGNYKHPFRLELDSVCNPEFAVNYGIGAPNKQTTRTKICQATSLVNSNGFRSSNSESGNQLEHVSVLTEHRESGLINSEGHLSEKKQYEKIKPFQEPLQTELTSKDDDSFRSVENESNSNDRFLSNPVPPSESSPDTSSPYQNPCKAHKQGEKKPSERCKYVICEGVHDIGVSSPPSSVSSQNRNKCSSSGCEGENPESTKPQNKRKITRLSETSSHDFRENLLLRVVHNRDQSSTIKDLIKTSPYIYLPLDHSAIFNKYSSPWAAKEPWSLIQSRSHNPSPSGSHANSESETLQTRSPKPESPSDKQTTSRSNSSNENEGR